MKVQLFMATDSSIRERFALSLPTMVQERGNHPSLFSSQNKSPLMALDVSRDHLEQQWLRG